MTDPATTEEPPAPAASATAASLEAPGFVRPTTPTIARVPVSGPEGGLSLALLLPYPFWVFAGNPSWAVPVLVSVAAGVALGLLLRRLPSPVPAISALPVGLAWVVSVLLLPASPFGLICAALVGIVLLLYAALPAPGEIPLPGGAVAAQAALPAAGGALAVAVSITLLGVSAPVFSLVLLPTLGALAIAVYLLSRGDPGSPRPASNAPAGAAARP